MLVLPLTTTLPVTELPAAAFGVRFAVNSAVEPGAR